jgi:hypothetical protein
VGEERRGEERRGEERRNYVLQIVFVFKTAVLWYDKQTINPKREVVVTTDIICPPSSHQLSLN